MDPVLVTALASTFAVVGSGVVSWLIARQNRAASRDVARTEADSVYAAKREEVQADAYEKARGSLEATIAVLERRALASQVEAEAAHADATKAREDAERCAGVVRRQEAELEHLRNQDAAKERIINRMRGEVRDLQAALRLAFPDEP